MKKLFLATAVALLGLVGLNAQSTGIEANVNVGIPMGDAKDFYSFNLGLDVAYYWNVAENFSAGASVGYDMWFSKEFDIPGFGKIKPDNGGFIPLAASAKYDFGGFFAGADLGYGISTQSGGGSAFYYRPRVGYATPSFDAFAFYKGYAVSGGSISSIGVGFGYKF